MDKLCPTCSLLTPKLLLSAEWKESLRDVLSEPENIHHVPDTSHMSKLELLALYITLKNEKNESE